MPAQGSSRFDCVRFTDWLRIAAKTTRRRALAHRLFREVAGDSIEDCVFARYLGIEYAFVVAKATGFAERRQLAIGSHGLVMDQQFYSVVAFEQLGPASRQPLSPRASELSDGLHELFLSMGKAKGYEEILTCILTAEWMYLTWCSEANRVPSRRGPIHYWVALHTSCGFVEHVDWVRAKLDARGPGLKPDHRRAASDIDPFRRPIDLIGPTGAHPRDQGLSFNVPTGVIIQRRLTPCMKLLRPAPAEGKGGIVRGDPSRKNTQENPTPYKPVHETVMDKPPTL
jgi:thiaminase/transcriptional activator TenA